MQNTTAMLLFFCLFLITGFLIEYGKFSFELQAFDLTDVETDVLNEILNSYQLEVSMFAALIFLTVFLASLTSGADQLP